MAICPNGHSSSTDDYCDTCGARISGSPPSASTTSAPQVSAPVYVSNGAPPPPGTEVCPDCGTPRTGRFCEEDGYDFENAQPRGIPYVPPPGPPPNQPPPNQPYTPPSTPSGPQYGPPSTPSAPQYGPSTQYGPPSTASAPQYGPPSTGSTPQYGPPSTGSAAQPYQAPYAPPSMPGTGWTAVINADRDYYESVLANDGPDASGIAFPPYCPERYVPLAGAQVRIGRRSQSRGIPEIDLSDPPGDPGVSRTHAVLLAQADGSWTLVDPGSANGTTLNGATEPIAINVQIPLKDGDRIHVGAWTTITIRRG